MKKKAALSSVDIPHVELSRDVRDFLLSLDVRQVHVVGIGCAVYAAGGEIFAAPAAAAQGIPHDFIAFLSRRVLYQYAGHNDLHR